MTIEEALYTARQYVNCRRATPQECRGINCRNCQYDFDISDLEVSVDMICERLTPKQLNEEGWSSEIVCCPTCGLHLWVKNPTKHCPECGQALDWSEIE